MLTYMYGIAPYNWMTLQWTIFQLYDANLYCTAFHDIMLAKEWIQLMLLLHVQLCCRNGPFIWSQVRVGWGRNFCFGTGSFFSGDVLFVRISCCCPSETELSTLYPCIFDTVYMMTSYTSLQNYGGEQYCHRDLPDWPCGTVSHRI
jgi:hypothetical protein